MFHQQHMALIIPSFSMKVRAVAFAFSRPTKLAFSFHIVWSFHVKPSCLDGSRTERSTASATVLSVLDFICFPLKDNWKNKLEPKHTAYALAFRKGFNKFIFYGKLILFPLLLAIVLSEPKWAFAFKRKIKQRWHKQTGWISCDHT